MVGRRGKEQLSGYCINIEQLSTVSYNYVDRLNNKTWLKELLEVLVVGKGFFLVKSLGRANPQPIRQQTGHPSAI